jgi:hypothetical protein
VYLISKKSEAIDKLKNFKAKLKISIILKLRLLDQIEEVNIMIDTPT